MRALTTGFLFFAYAFVAMTVGAFIWRAGLGGAPGFAATVGTLGLLGSVHLFVASFGQRKSLRREIGQVRQAHLLLADAMEQQQIALSELAQAIEAGALQTADELTGEVRMLETLIQQMSESIDEKLKVAPMIAPDSQIGRASCRERVF